MDFLPDLRVERRCFGPWTNAMKHAKQEITSVAVQGVPMGGYNGNNYADCYSSQANNGNIPYEQVAGNWTVPTVPSDGSTNEVGSWVGIGGILSGGKNELQHAGVISIASSPLFWLTPFVYGLAKSVVISSSLIPRLHWRSRNSPNGIPSPLG